MSNTVITIFRSRLRPEAGEDYRHVAAEMDTLAQSMPGFVEAKQFVADDGERVTLVTFEREETQRAWREHPDHQRAQGLGRTDFYQEYALTVCRPMRSSCFTRDT